MKWFIGYVAALCIWVLIVCESIAFPTFFLTFYRYEYDKNQTPEIISVEKEELMSVTVQLLDYMRGRRADLVVEAVVDGQPREFFNQKEKDHMADVRALFETGFMVRNIAFWSALLLFLLMILLKIRIPLVMARCCREVLFGFLLMAALLTVVIALDFNRAFNVFHMLFFTNDLWVLDPQTDLLINMVPLSFFIDIAIFIGGLMVSLSVTIIVASTLYLRRVSRRERYPRFD